MKKIILALLITSTIYAGGIFSIGSKNIGFTIGSSKSFGNDYTVLGANVNYFILDNLSMGAAYQAYLGGSPDIQQLTVPVTYHLPLENTTYRPYLGAFYSKTFIEAPYDDYNVYGGRAGVSLQTSPNSFVSFGWVEEFSRSDKGSNTRGYPEVSGRLSF